MIHFALFVYAVLSDHIDITCEVLTDDEFVHVEGAVDDIGVDRRDVRDAIGPVRIKFTIVNNEADSVLVDTRDTPLHDPIHSNNFGHDGDVEFLGNDVEIKGEVTDNDLRSFDRGTTEVTAVYDRIGFADTDDGRAKIRFLFNLMVDGEQRTFKPECSVKVWPEYRIVDDDEYDDDQRAKSEFLKETGDTGEKRVGSSEGFTYTKGSDGIPTVQNPTCADHPEKTGWTYSSGASVPCDSHKSRGRCESDANVKTHCAVTCDNCNSPQREKWAKPDVDKDNLVTYGADCSRYSITYDGVTRTEKEWLELSEKQKTGMCASILYHIENKDDVFKAQYTKWFGGPTSFTDDRYKRLREGFIKICSLKGYHYVCTPTDGNSCNNFQMNVGSDRYTGTQNSNRNSVNKILQDRKSNSYSYSGTSAWVCSGCWTRGRREINLCEVMFWMGNDDITDDVRTSRTSVIFHEIAHFTDMGNTDDIRYDVESLLRGARNYPAEGDWMDSSANWHSFAEEVSGFVKIWADFMTHGGGSVPQPQPSAPQPQPRVDCVVTSWENSGSCTNSCGGGKQDQRRSVQTSAANGGTACPSDLTRQIDCNTAACPAPSSGVSEYKESGQCKTGASEDECRTQAENDGRWGGTETTSGWPLGCYKYGSSSTYYYNKRTSSSSMGCDSGSHKGCWCKEPGTGSGSSSGSGSGSSSGSGSGSSSSSSSSSTSISIAAIGSHRCSNYGLADSPRATCIQYGQLSGRTFADKNSANFPTGCFRVSSNQVYYNSASGTTQCSMTNICICVPSSAETAIAMKPISIETMSIAVEPTVNGMSMANIAVHALAVIGFASTVAFFYRQAFRGDKVYTTVEENEI